jgi:hypothetical protein
MIHRLLTVAFALALFVGSASATDIDRHGTFTEKGAPAGAAAQCKNFSGTDDNRSACTDWCSAYTSSNSGATCACDDGACVEAAVAPQAAAAPAPAQ